MTDIMVSILTKYERLDRFFQSFGFITFSRRGFKEIIDVLPDAKIKELASNNAASVVEFIDFRFKKRDLDNLIGTLEILSKYQRKFDYDLLRNNSGVVITLRTDLGEKFTLFLSEQYRAVITDVLGVAPIVELGRNQVTFRIGKSQPSGK